MNANLASVHNMHDYHEIQKLIMSASYEFKPSWIGGSDAQMVRILFIVAHHLIIIIF